MLLSTFSKSLSGTLSECQTVWIQIRIEILSILILVQTVCNVCDKSHREQGQSFQTFQTHQSIKLFGSRSGRHLDGQKSPQAGKSMIQNDALNRSLTEHGNNMTLICDLISLDWQTYFAQISLKGTSRIFVLFLITTSTLLLLGNCACFIVVCFFFSKSTFSKKNSGIPPERQRVWI